MGAKLVVEEGNLKGLVVELGEEAAKGGQWILGRDPELCQIVLEDPTISRSHLLIRKTEEGLVAENLSETNPTLLNDAELEEAASLNQGDLFKLGGNLLRLYLKDEPVIEEAGEEPNLEEEEERQSIFEEEEDSLAELGLDLMDTAPWLLKVVSGPNNGAQFSMHLETSYTIGSDPAACDIVFHDVSVSRRHAKLTIGREGALSIEDLGSSNGTVVEGKKIEGRRSLEPNTLVSLGTSSFVVFDRERERQTVISPLLPAIVKVLKEGEEKKESAETAKKREAEHKALEEARALEQKKRAKKRSSLLFFSILGAFALIILTGLSLLFFSQEIEMEPVNVEKTIERVLDPYPAVKYTYNPSTGRLTLVGHVKTAVDNAQIMHDLNPLDFIHAVDNNITIDEYIWQETNQYLSRRWKGVTLNIPNAGEYVLTGTLQTKKEAAALNDYINTYFLFLQKLENRVFVEEEILDRVRFLLSREGFNNLEASLSNREVDLKGKIAYGEMPRFEPLIEEIKAIPGVNRVFSFVTEAKPLETMINLTPEYQVSGSLRGGDGKITVIINGKGIREGDMLDGRLVTKIEPNTIYLESGNQKYRIDYK